MSFHFVRNHAFDRQTNKTAHCKIMAAQLQCGKNLGNSHKSFGRYCVHKRLVHDHIWTGQKQNDSQQRHKNCINGTKNYTTPLNLVI